MIFMIIMVIRTDRTHKQTGQTDLTLKLDFPRNLCRAAFAIPAMFYFRVANFHTLPTGRSRWNHICSVFFVVSNTHHLQHTSSWKKGFVFCLFFLWSPAGNRLEHLGTRWQSRVVSMHCKSFWGFQPFSKTKTKTKASGVIALQELLGISPIYRDLKNIAMILCEWTIHKINKIILQYKVYVEPDKTLSPLITTHWKVPQMESFEIKREKIF